MNPRAPLGKLNPTNAPDAGHEQQHEDVADEIGRGPAGQHRRTGHGERPEPFDETLLEVFGQPHGGADPPKRHALDEDPRHQEVDVAEAGDGVDGAPEHVPEQQHEHDGLQVEKNSDSGMRV